MKEVNVMTIFYRLGDIYYINITNHCSCDCIFCIRNSGDSVGGADSLWLPREPSVTEIKSAFDAINLRDINEIVFCGYGEPTERADDMVEIAEYIKSKTDLPLRLNTNGSLKLTCLDFDLSRLRIFDFISISLNADNAADYQKLTRSRFGENAFDSMLDFAREVKQFTQVIFSVVDVNNESLNIKKCEIISDELQIPLRIRAYGM
jgi:TatD family-associated radical SAM protein